MGTSNNPNGRPKEFGERKTITVSLPPEAIRMLDIHARCAGVSRNQLITNYVSIGLWLDSNGQLRHNDDNTVSYRAAQNRALLKEQVLSGVFDRLPEWNLTLGFAADEKAGEKLDEQ